MAHSASYYSISEHGTAADIHNLPPFIQKLWEMISSPDLNHVIHWSADGNSIVINSAEAFTALVLPRFFKHNNIASFTRQLNWYGFAKQLNSDDRDASMHFKHPKFRRGHPEELYLIRRRLHVMNASSADHEDVAELLRGRLNRHKPAAPAAPKPEPSRRSTRKHRDSLDTSHTDAGTEEAHMNGLLAQEELVDKEHEPLHISGRHRDEESPGAPPASFLLGNAEITPPGVQITLPPEHEHPEDLASRVDLLQRQVQVLSDQVKSQQHGLRWLTNQLHVLASTETAPAASMERVLYGLYSSLDDAGFRMYLATSPSGEKTVKFKPPPSLAIVESETQPQNHLSFAEFKGLVTQASWWPHTSEHLTRVSSYGNSLAKRARVEEDTSHEYTDSPSGPRLLTDGHPVPVSGSGRAEAQPMFPPIFVSPSFPDPLATITPGPPAEKPQPANAQLLRRMHTFDDGEGDDRLPDDSAFLVSPSEFFEVPVDPHPPSKDDSALVGNKRPRRASEEPHSV